MVDNEAETGKPKKQEQRRQMRITPLHIEIMIQALCSPSVEPEESEAACCFRLEMETEGLIISERNEERRVLLWRATDKGKAWLDMLCKTPMPIASWSDPRTAQERRTPERGKHPFDT